MPRTSSALKKGQALKMNVHLGQSPSKVSTFNTKTTYFNLSGTGMLNLVPINLISFDSLKKFCVIYFLIYSHNHQIGTGG